MRDILFTLCRRYVSALKSWGWILVILAFVTASIGLYEVKSRQDNERVAKKDLAVNVVFYFDRLIKQSNSAILAAAIKERVKSLQPHPDVIVLYKDSANANSWVDRGTLVIKSKDESALENVVEAILPPIDQEFTRLLMDRERSLSLTVDLIEKNIGDELWIKEQVASLERVTSLEGVFVELGRLKASLNGIRQALDDLSYIRTIERVDRQVDLVSGSSVRDIAPTLLLFALGAALLLVLIFDVGLLATHQLVRHDDE